MKRLPLIFLLLLPLASCTEGADPEGRRPRADAVHSAPRASSHSRDRRLDRADAIRIELAPGARGIERNEAPPLTTILPDATGPATVEPSTPFDWTATNATDAKTSIFDCTIKLSDAEAPSDFILTVWDWENRAVWQSKLSLSADRPQPLELHIAGRGVYMLTLDGFSDGKLTSRLVRSVAAIAPASEARTRWAAGDYWLGFCAFPGRYHWNLAGRPTLPAGLKEQEAREREAEMMSRLGLSIVRLDVSMVLPQKADAPIDWKRMDAAVNAYTSRGMKLALQLMHPPDWAIDPKYEKETEHRWRFPRREDDYRRYVREIVTRYGKHAAFVQVYNEPDQVEFWAASPQEYVKEFAWAKQEIRKVLPDVPITNGGYAFIDPARTVHYVRALRGDTDLQAYHSHGNLRELIRDFEHMRELHRDVGYDMPRYINTECGYAAWRLDQERTQAAVLLQKALYSWAHGDKGMLLFASRMTKGPGPGSRTHRDFGLLDGRFCPRFAYGTVAAFSRIYAGAKFERVLSEQRGTYVYSFKRDGRHLVAAFAVDKPATLKLETDAKTGEVIDAMGNAEALNNPRAIELKAGAMLTTVELDGATSVKVVE